MFIKEFPCKARNVTSGLIAGTLVEGARGWVAVENLRIGDAVQSYDGGLARVLGLDRNWVATAIGAYVLHLPGGALDNCSDLVLLPGQNVLVDTLGDADLPDDLVVLMPAAALEGVLGTTRMRIEKPIEVITPRFADDEAIFANSGTLLHCPGIRHTAQQPASMFFRQLDLTEAKAFLRGPNRAFSLLRPSLAA
jgi:Hint domain